MPMPIIWSVGAVLTIILTILTKEDPVDIGFGMLYASAMLILSELSRIREALEKKNKEEK